MPCLPPRVGRSMPCFAWFPECGGEPIVRCASHRDEVAVHDEFVPYIKAKQGRWQQHKATITINPAESTPLPAALFVNWDGCRQNERSSSPSSWVSSCHHHHNRTPSWVIRIACDEASSMHHFHLCMYIIYLQ